MNEFTASAAMGARVLGRALVGKDGFFPPAMTRTARTACSLGRSTNWQASPTLIASWCRMRPRAAWMLHEMRSRGVMPAALVLNSVNPIMAQGAALADFTMISGFSVDITQAVPDGALVAVDPDSDPPCLRVLTEDHTSPALAGEVDGR
jgi:hypothetical protein